MEERQADSRSTNSPLSGLFPSPFFKLSVARCLSSSSALACRDGAALVSSKMWRFLRSCSSGRVCTCYSRLLRRSAGEIGEMSMPAFSEEVLRVGGWVDMVVRWVGVCSGLVWFGLVCWVLGVGMVAIGTVVRREYSKLGVCR